MSRTTTLAVVATVVLGFAMATGAVVAETITRGTDDTPMGPSSPVLGFNTTKMLCSQHECRQVTKPNGTVVTECPCDTATETSTDYCTSPGAPGIACKQPNPDAGTSTIDPADLPPTTLSGTGQLYYSALWLGPHTLGYSNLFRTSPDGTLYLVFPTYNTTIAPWWIEGNESGHGVTTYLLNDGTGAGTFTAAQLFVGTSGLQSYVMLKKYSEATYRGYNVIEAAGGPMAATSSGVVGWWLDPLSGTGSVGIKNTEPRAEDALDVNGRIAAANKLVSSATNITLAGVTATATATATKTYTYRTTSTATTTGTGTATNTNTLTGTRTATVTTTQSGSGSSVYTLEGQDVTLNLTGVATDTHTNLVHGTVAANVIPKSDGSGGLVASSLSDNGTNVNIAEPVTLAAVDANNVGLTAYPSANNTRALFRMIPHGSPSIGNGTSGVQWFNTDFVADASNYEYSQFAWVNNAMQLIVGKAGTGTLRQLILGSVANQLVFQPDGTTVFGSTSTQGAPVSIYAANVTVPALGAQGGTFAILNGSGGVGKYGLLVGQTGYGWSFLQTQRVDGSATAYGLMLQPNGGGLGVGISNTSGPTAGTIDSAFALRLRGSSSGAVTATAAADGSYLNLDKQLYTPNFRTPTVASAAGKFMCALDTSGTSAWCDIAEGNVTNLTTDLGNKGATGTCSSGQYVSGIGASSLTCGTPTPTFSGLTTGNLIIAGSSTTIDSGPAYSATPGASKVAQADGAGTLNSWVSHASDDVSANGAITGATHTKITYDSKGLVTAGSDATAADVGAVPATYLFTQFALGGSVNTGGDTNWHNAISTTVVTPTAGMIITVNGFVAVEGGAANCHAAAFVDSTSSAGTSDAMGAAADWIQTLPVGTHYFAASAGSHTVVLAVSSDSSANPCIVATNKAHITILVTPN